MPGSVNITEARAQPVLSPDVDFAMCVIGYASDSPLPAGQVSAQYSDPTTLAGDYGIGDGVDCATHAITKTDGNPAPPPIALCPVPATTPGAMGTIDTAGATGTADNVGISGSAAVTNTSGAQPKGTYQIVGRVADDGNDGAGTPIGTAGIMLEFSLDDARTFLPRTALGAATVKAVELPGSIATGASFDFGPTTTNAALITAAVEARADTLAHLADVVAHDAADTSAAQIALAASGVPATVAAAIAVYVLIDAAYESHLSNIAAHNGPDPVNVMILAPPTTTQEGVDYAVQYKAKFNAHLGIALAADPVALKVATATSGSPVTLVLADLLAPGLALMATYPRRITFTTAGVDPADAPANVVPTGTDYADAVETETLVLAQTAAAVTTVEAYKTITALAYPAGEGADATIAIGIGQGVHNSADSTNTISAADPTYGLLKTGDTWRSVTTPPVAAVGDLYTAAVGDDDPTGAFAAIAQSATEFGVIVLEQPLSSTNFATVVAGLNYGATQGKDWTLVTRFRDPGATETDAAYIAAFKAFAEAHSDNRICVCVGSGWLTDGFRAYRYLRSGLPAVLARLQSHAVIPGKLGEKLAQHPGWVQRGPLELFTITDAASNLIGHDEKLRSGIDGPIGGVGGGLTFYRIPNPNLPGTFISEAPVLYPALSQVLLLPDRRVHNGIKRVASAVLWTEIKGADIISDTTPRTLDDEIRDGIQGKVRKAIVDRYSAEIQNASDPNLVSISPTVTVAGANVTISGVIGVRVYGYTHVINIVFSATR